MAAKFLRAWTLPDDKLAVLQVCRDSVEMSDWAAFVEACERLLGSSQPRLVLDLRALHRVLSIFIGQAVQTSDQARKRSQRFTVLASGDLARLFKSILGSEIVEIATEEDAPPWALKIERH